MLQAARVLTPEQNFKIAYREIRNISEESPEKNNAFEAIKSDLFNDVAPLYYNGRIRISFSLADTYKPNFILIKGLLEFHRPVWVAFQYDKKQHRIETDIASDQLHQLATFLTMVTLWLKKEIQFQHALKRAIEFEKRYKVEADGIYSVFNSLTAGTV